MVRFLGSGVPVCDRGQDARAVTAGASLIDVQQAGFQVDRNGITGTGNKPAR